MQKLIIIAGATLATLVSPAGAATRSYIVTDYDSIRLEAPIDVTVETRRGVSARGEGDADMLSRVDLSVASRTLTIRLKPAFFEARREKPQGPVKLVLTAQSLRRLELSGAGSLRANGLDRLKADIISAGNGTIAVSGIDADMLTVVQNGSGTIVLTGKAKTLALQLVGSGSLDGKAMTASDLTLVIDGAANAETVANRSAKLTVTGPGGAAVAGKASCTVNHTGSGAVSCGDRSY